MCMNNFSVISRCRSKDCGIFQENIVTSWSAVHPWRWKKSRSRKPCGGRRRRSLGLRGPSMMNRQPTRYLPTSSFDTLCHSSLAAIWNDSIMDKDPQLSYFCSLHGSCLQTLLSLVFDTCRLQRRQGSLSLEHDGHHRTNRSFSCLFSLKRALLWKRTWRTFKWHVRGRCFTVASYL